MHQTHDQLQEGEDAGEYFVSITDLMTGVVFIFVILLTAYALIFHEKQKEALANAERAKQQEENARIVQKQAEAAESRAKQAEKEAEEKKRALEEQKNALNDALESNQRKARQIDALAELLRTREQTRRKMLSALEQELLRQNVRVTLDLDNGIIRLPESLLFAPGIADLSEEGREALFKLGRQLILTIRQWSPEGSKFRLESVFIEGHTDNTPIHNAEFQSNWELSTKRAVNTSSALTTSAVELLTLRNSSGAPILGVSGYGENRPVADNNSDDGRRRNRRIDIRFIVAYPTAAQFEEVQRLLDGKMP